VISLTNIGDIVLTFPVIDILVENFPQAEVSVVVGPKGKSLFRDNIYFKNVYVFDKRQALKDTLSWICELRKQKFDLVVDLRNSATPFFLSPRYRTSFRMKKVQNMHMREKHLRHLRSIYDYPSLAKKRYAMYFPQDTQQKVQNLIRQEVGENRKFIVIAPGAADGRKRWTEEGYAEVGEVLSSKYGYKIVFVGDQNDFEVVQHITQKMRTPAVNLCGRTDLMELAAILEKCHLAIMNDSAPMHLASYLNKSVLTIFGPTDPVKYGPWSSHCCYLKSPSTSNQEKATPPLPISSITSQQVLGVIRIEDDKIIFTKEHEYSQYV